MKAPKKPQLSIAHTTAPAVVKGVRGLFREEIAPPGERWFKIVSSAGKVGLVHLPEELCDEWTEERLWAWLDDKNPERPPLTLA